jgi:hypothetical protein
MSINKVLVDAVVEMPDGEIEPDYHVGEFDDPKTVAEVQEMLRDNYDVGTVLSVSNFLTTIKEPGDDDSTSLPTAERRSNTDVYGRAKRIRRAAPLGGTQSSSEARSDDKEKEV